MGKKTISPLSGSNLKLSLNYYTRKIILSFTNLIPLEYPRKAELGLYIQDTPEILLSLAA